MYYLHVFANLVSVDIFSGTAGTDHNSIEKDPLEYFLNEKIQNLMLAITGNFIFIIQLMTES